MSTDLPVTLVLDKLLTTLQNQKVALLEAPPGAGKSTLVPPALLKSGLAGKGKIYLLEPRRLAARSLAHFISRELNEKVGGLCGYRVHRETRVSSQTRIEVITEGVLIRMLQSDPALEEGSVVIFDEFHERSILSDLALTLLLEVKKELRDDLILLFMSATPDSEALETVIPGLPVIKSEGRQYPVDIYYRPADPRSVAVSTIKEALEQTEGDVLIFLPGEREITRWQGELSRSLGAATTSPEILPLFGRMTLEKQNRVISAHSDNRRRIVLATDIAETSLTIPGVTAVVDTGLTRRPLFNSSSGLTLLETAEISLASAKQRSGRAGRVSPGVCYRLWDESTERGRDSQTPPEILQADLAPLVLELARWGCTDPDERSWLTPPPTGAWRTARELLRLLGALDGEGKITPRGKEIASLPVHPRVAGLLLYGREKGLLSEACLMGAFLEQRDFLPTSLGSDIMARMEYLTGGRSPGEYSRQVKQIREEARHLEEILSSGSRNLSMVKYDTLFREGASLLAQAYPDRIALQLNEGIYQLSGGGRLVLNRDDPLSIHPLLVAAHCGGNPHRQRLYLGLPIERKEIELLLADRITEEVQGSWNRDKKRITTVKRRRLGEITLTQTPMKSPGVQEASRIMQDALMTGGLEILPWDRESRRLWDRMVFVAEQAEGEFSWPDLTLEGLSQRVDEWLIPFFTGSRLEGKLTAPLLSLLEWKKQQELDRITPDYYRTALGNRRKIEYGQSDPYLPVPLQEMYGVKSSPLLGNKPLVLHLLNPAGRPAQVTADLESFWKEVWPSVRGELKGRYPKHYWPENPAEAQPSLMTGKRRPED
jgi:ATP-dependent helicase HrpB